MNLNVLVENHGGLSSNAAWLASVIRKGESAQLRHPARFWKFQTGGWEQYDRYQGVAEMMPLAKAVSAKSRILTPLATKSQSDYRRMMQNCARCGLPWLCGH